MPCSSDDGTVQAQGYLQIKMMLLANFFKYFVGKPDDAVLSAWRGYKWMVNTLSGEIIYPKDAWAGEQIDITFRLVDAYLAEKAPVVLPAYQGTICELSFLFKGVGYVKDLTDGPKEGGVLEKVSREIIEDGYRSKVTLRGYEGGMRVSIKIEGIHEDRNVVYTDEYYVPNSTSLPDEESLDRFMKELRERNSNGALDEAMKQVVRTVLERNTQKPTLDVVGGPAGRKAKEKAEAKSKKLKEKTDAAGAKDSRKKGQAKIRTFEAME